MGSYQNKVSFILTTQVLHEIECEIELENYQHDEDNYAQSDTIRKQMINIWKSHANSWKPKIELHL